MNATNKDPLAVFASSIPEQLPLVGTDARKAIESDFLTALSLSMGMDAEVLPTPFVDDGDDWIDFGTDVKVPGLPDGLAVDFRLSTEKATKSSYAMAIVLDECGHEYATGDNSELSGLRALVDSLVQMAKKAIDSKVKR